MFADQRADMPRVQLGDVGILLLRMIEEPVNRNSCSVPS